MNQELRIKLSKCVFFIALFFILIALFLPYPIFAACDAAEAAKPVELRSADCPAGLDQIEQVVSKVISAVVALGFIALLILVLWSGIKFITSGGEPKALQSARATFAWAILGIIFMALAWLILLLIENFTGIEVTVFNIKTLCGDAALNFPFCQPK